MSNEAAPSSEATTSSQPSPAPESTAADDVNRQKVGRRIWQQVFGFFNKRLPGITYCGGVMTALFLYITVASYDCEQHDPVLQRPLLGVIGAFTLAGIAYLWACYQLIRKPGGGDKTETLATVIVLGVLFRFILLFSVPIQEVDLYRYIWDGTVFSTGIDPYEYSPLEIQNFEKLGPKPYRTTTEEKRQMSRLANIAAQPGMAAVMKLVHFEEYTTPYPATNQGPFALASVMGRTGGDFLDQQFGIKQGTFWTLLFSMKTVLTCFDLGVGLFLILLLRRLNLPMEWSVAYLWCPLVLKEIANSGHLDSIAVFFTMAAVFTMIIAYWRPANSTQDNTADASTIDSKPTDKQSVRVWVQEVAPPNARHSVGLSFVVAILLALGVAAKIYPAVLAPMWAIVAFKRIKLAALAPMVVFVALTVFMLWPMVGRTEGVKNRIKTITQLFSAEDSDEQNGDPSPTPSTDATAVNAQPAKEPTAPPPGIEAFAKRWEMNDFLFMAVIENVRPNSAWFNDLLKYERRKKAAEEIAEGNKSGAQASGQPLNNETGQQDLVEEGSPIWFVKTKNSWRQQFVNWYSEKAGVPVAEAPFSFTRRLTLVFFLLLVVYACFRVLFSDHPAVFLEMIFLTVAWFWLLAPTQNPWYWTWSVPFLIFCRNPVWFLVAITSLAYYLRFYFQYHFDGPGEGLWGTPFRYTNFFDFYIPVAEFAPLLILLVIVKIGMVVYGLVKTPAAVTAPLK